MKRRYIGKKIRDRATKLKARPFVIFEDDKVVALQDHVVVSEALNYHFLMKGESARGMTVDFPKGRYTFQEGVVYQHKEK